jgi:hypothetical protein
VPLCELYFSRPRFATAIVFRWAPKSWRRRERNFAYFAVNNSYPCPIRAIRDHKSQSDRLSLGIYILAGLEANSAV